MSKAFEYTGKVTTSICDEIPVPDNPFVAQERYVGGYSMPDLVGQASVTQILYLLIKGELPSKYHEQLLEKLFVGLACLGPRDPATRAAMVAGASKTLTQNILPVALMVGSGERHGAAEVEKAYQYYHKHSTTPVDHLLKRVDDAHEKIPGMGACFGSVDPLMQSLFSSLLALDPYNPLMRWLDELNTHLSEYKVGILDTGIAAAVGLVMQVGARESLGLYQMARAPGLFAHGVEQTHKPITAMPMVKDEDVEFVAPNK